MCVIITVTVTVNGSSNNNNISPNNVHISYQTAWEALTVTW